MPSTISRSYRKLYRGVQIGARIAVFAVTIVAFIASIIIGLTQLESFRTWAITEGLAALNNQLLGRVEVDGVSGNFLTGLKLRGVRLYADSTLMIDAPVVELNYELRPVFQQKVVGARAILHRPRVHLVRNRRDSVWNFDRITRPSVDSVSTPFGWDIEVQAFEIIDGEVVINDRTTEPDIDTVSRRVDYTHLELEDVNLALQAHITPIEQDVWIQNLAFDAPQPDVRVIQLAAQLSVDTTGLTVRDFVLETGRSYLTLAGRIDSVDFIGTDTAVRSWENFPLTLALKADRVSTLELRRFVGEDLDFLAGTPALELDVHGSFADVRIDKLRLGLPRTQLTLTGRLRNLNDPDSLAIDANVSDSYVTYADVMDHLPGLDLPDLRYLGRGEIRSASFNGLPELFTATIDARTDIGAARGGAWLDLRGERMAYTADLGFERVDFAPLTGDPDLESDFTGRIVTNGVGTSLDELAARVRLESQNSIVAGREYRMLYFDGGIGDGGFVTADTLLVAWGGSGRGGSMSTATQPDLPTLTRTLSRGRESYVTSQLPLTPTARGIFASNRVVGAGGWIDLRNIDVPKYDLDVRARNVNLAEVLLDPEYESDLTFTASIKGAGLSPDDIDGSGTLAIAPSTIGGEALPATDATFTLEQLGGGRRSLVLESDAADVKVDGTWSFETLVNSAARGVNALVEYASRTGSYQPQPMIASSTTIATPIDATYELNIKDLSRLSGFLKGTDIAARGVISGEIKGNSRSLDISAIGDLDQLRFRQGSTDLSLGAADLDIRLTGITPYGITSATSGSVRVRSDSLLRFGDMTFTVPSMALDLHDGLIDLRGATVINREISIVVHGQVDARNPAGYLVRVDTLLVNLPERMYSWRNIGTIEAVVADDFIRIDSMTVQRANAEIINVSGALAGDRLENVQVKVVEASIADLTSLMQSASDDAYGMRDISGYISNGVVTLNGTLDNPIISGQIAIDSVIYSGSRVGNFVASFNYSDLNAAGTIIVNEVQAGGDTMRTPAKVDIRSLPIDLALASREERLLSGKPVDIRVTADSLPVAFIAPFVPGIRLQRGTADLNFQVGGTLPNADYQGSVELSNVWATVEANNVLYRVNGRATFQDNVLGIEKMIVRNDPRELAESGAEITGRIIFEGLSPSDLDISIDARRLLVLSEASETADLGVYGDVVIRTGDRPLTLTGTLASPRLLGDVVILSGDLRIPESESRLASDEVVTFIDYSDWVRLTRTTYGPEFPSLPVATDSSARPAADPHAVENAVQSGSLQQAAAGLQQYLDSARSRGQTVAPSFADALSADLNVSMDQPITIRMNMGPFEQLRLEVRQSGRDVNFEMRPGETPQLWGQFMIERGSEYTYIKKFEATGEVRFQGDITNPYFTINAIYNGRRFSESGTGEDYEVTVAINGTPENLSRPEFNYTIGGQTSNTDPETRFRNAISLLLFGRTADELRATGVGTHVQALASSALSSGTSSVASTALSDAFAGSFVRSVDLEFGDDIDQTRLNFVSQFGKVTFRYGGDVANPSQGLASLEVPVYEIKDAESLRNHVLQFQREVRSSEAILRSGGGTSQTETWRIRYQIRFSF